MSNRRRILMGQSKGGSRLPKQYQEIEYLESTGTQFIDTGINAATYRKSLDYDIIAYLNNSNISNTYILCGDHSAGSIAYRGVNGVPCYVYYSNTPDRIIYIDGTTISDGVYHIEYKNEILSIGEAVGQNISDTGNRYEGTYKLFKGWHERGWVANGKVKLGRCLFSYNEIPIKDFIPCYRKSDSKPGMYDLVSGQFFTNQGSGEFVIGPEIYELNQVQLVEYLYSDLATIDNIYTGTLGLHFEAKVDIKQIYSWQSVGGLNVGSGSSAFGFQRNGTGNIIYFNNNIRNTQINIPSGTGKYLFVVDNATDASIKNWDGVVIGSGSAGWGLSKTVSVQLRGTELYYMIIGDNIYLPCIIGAKIGLYNKTAKTFFPCTSGTITPGQNI